MVALYKIMNRELNCPVFVDRLQLCTPLPGLRVSTADIHRYLLESARNASCIKIYTCCGDNE